jgi:hypothetical protein
LAWASLRGARRRAGEVLTTRYKQAGLPGRVTG